MAKLDVDVEGIIAPAPKLEDQDQKEESQYNVACLPRYLAQPQSTCRAPALLLCQRDRGFSTHIGLRLPVF